MTNPHRSSKPGAQEEKRVPTVSMDYFLMGAEGVTFDDGDAGPDDALPMLALKDHQGRMVFAHAVPRKGADQHVVRSVIEDLEVLGHRRLILKSDQERSILAVKREVKSDMQDTEVLFEESRMGESASNGVIEAAIKDSALIGCCVKLPMPILQKFYHRAGALHHKAFVELW